MKKLTRRDFLKLAGLAIAGAVASQIPIKDTPPATVDRFAKELKFGDNFPPHQLPSRWDEYDTLIGKNAGKDCDNYTVLIGTMAEPYGWYHRAFREMAQGCKQTP